MSRGIERAWLRAGLASLVLALAIPGEPAARPSIPHRTVVLQGLDKITARVRPVTAPVDEVTTFGTLEIVPRACLTAPPIDAPEAAAFLEISELERDGGRTLLFSGWMFASSPGLSALEHAVYDVWVLRCEVPAVESSAGDAPLQGSAPLAEDVEGRDSSSGLGE